MNSLCHGYFEGRLLQISIIISPCCLRVDPGFLLITMCAIIIQWRSIFKGCVVLAQNHSINYQNILICFCQTLQRSTYPAQLSCATPRCHHFFLAYITSPLPYLNLPSSSSLACNCLPNLYFHLLSLVLSHTFHSVTFKCPHKTSLALLKLTHSASVAIIKCYLP